MNKVYKYLIFSLYFLSLINILYCIKVRLTNEMEIYTISRIILLLFSCVFIYLAGYILVNKFSFNKKILKYNLIIYLIIYTITVIMFTLFDSVFGRNGFIFIKWNKDLFDMYIRNSFNIIPFKTIELYVIGYLNGIVTVKSFLINIIGNLFIFMPYAVILPLLINKRYYYYLILMTISIIIIELLQFLTLSGSCDIDDIILNVLGFSMLYFLTKIKIIKSIIYKIFLFQ